jgi:hypothetical protein
MRDAGRPSRYARTDFGPREHAGTGFQAQNEPTATQTSPVHLRWKINVLSISRRESAQIRLLALRAFGAGLLALTLTGCGGGGGGGGTAGNAPEQGTQIVTPAFETYTTDHNGYSRVRLQTAAGDADRAILDRFDDPARTGPADYRNLIALTEDRYRDTMTLEVIAQVSGSGDGEKVERILRLTADQAPFDNVDSRGNLIASGKYYFRGSAEVYATVDGGGLQRGVGDLENMVVDFDRQTVRINLRTPFDPGAGSDIETEIDARGLSLNVLTGAFGGAVKMTTRSAETGDTLTSSGQLRGSLNGDAAGLSRLIENMTTSGLFTVGGDRDRFQAEGIFWGSQLNYAD